MTITYKSLLRLNYPLFVLPNDNWFSTDGVLFLDDKVLDERNMPGETLGIRRIQCGRSDLQPLKKAVFHPSEMVNNRHKFFIDSKGTPLIYEKTYSSKLKCYKIKSVQHKGEASLLWLHGVSFPITIPRPPGELAAYARVLHQGRHPWLLYDYVSHPTKDTYRKV